MAPRASDRAGSPVSDYKIIDDIGDNAAPSAT
jgi:hypothetical protein